MPSIAVLGASRDRNKFGNKAVRAFAGKGYTVYPIHPREKEIEGHRAYPSIGDVPAAYLDMVSVYLPPEIGLKVIEEVARKKVGEVWLNPGAESDELIDKAGKLGLNVIAACSLVGHGISPASF